MRYIVVSHDTGKTLFIALSVAECEAWIAAHGLRGECYIK